MFDTLSNTVTNDKFNKACVKLTEYFLPNKNTEYGIYLFSHAKQNTGKTLATYVIHLRQLAATCDVAENESEIK